jgi:aryl-alcohol dehydrogenase-like predicted oxidoreductase
MTAESVAQEADARNTRYFPRFQGEALEANLRLVDEVKAIAERKGVTPGQIALAWVLAQGDDVVPIPGTKRVKYLEENAASRDVVLAEEDLEALERAVPRGAVVGSRYGDMSHIDQG